MEGERGCCDVALIRLLPRCPSHTVPPTSSSSSSSCCSC